YALGSDQIQKQALNVATGTAQLTIPLGGLRNFQIQLPSLEEQKEIVRRVEKMFAKIDKMEEEYQKAAKLCDRLEQATLAKAFRGELVPQDPNDEPASVLLEQVKKEKEKGKKGVKSK
ncbi:MAG: restriction endonuclease subunit S, partial [Pseudanabaena sp.]